MNGPWARPLAVLAAVSLALSLGGCGESLHNRAEAQIARLDAKFVRLGEELDAGGLRNAVHVREYANRVRDLKPELRSLVDVLALEGTRDGTMYRALQTRLKDVRSGMPDPGAPDEAYVDIATELTSLGGALVPAEFDRALADPLNVLADLSAGELPRVDAISAAASARANGTADLGTGSQLVGNPHYGSWRSDSSGSSFWVWYGQFALMQSLVGGPPIGYGAWAGGRNYSYYHDYGRHQYTSPAARQRQTQVASTAQRKFASEGRTFRSPYARTRQGASNNVTRAKFASTGRTTAGTTRSRTGTASVRGFGGGGYRGASRGK